MVPRSWIKECSDLFGVTDNIKTLLVGKVVRESEVKINHLLFMHDLKLYSRNEKELDSLVQTICIFSKDIGMDFSIEKYAMLVLEKGKIVKSVGIELSDGKVIRSLQEGESYTYLGIL